MFFKLLINKLLNSNKIIFRSLFSTGIYMILYSIFLTACGNSGKQQNDWDRMNLKGKVKRILTEVYPSHEHFEKKYQPTKKLMKFNEQGLITIYNEEVKSQLTRQIDYNYNDNQAWLKESLKNNQRPGMPQQYWQYELNDKGVQESITCFQTDSSVLYKIILKNNSKGKPINSSYVDCLYPERNPCRVERQYDNNGFVKEEWTYAYEVVTKSCAKTPVKVHFEVNEHGDVVREERNYPKQSRIQKEEIVYQYTYDEQGNWLTKKFIIQRIPRTVEARTIVYYE